MKIETISELRTISRLSTLLREMRDNIEFIKSNITRQIAVMEDIVSDLNGILSNLEQEEFLDKRGKSTLYNDLCRKDIEND